MPSGKQSKRRRRQAELAAPPPVRSKGAPGGRGTSWLQGANVWWLGGGAVVVLAVVLAIVFTRGSAKPFHVDFAQMSGLQTGALPWNNGVGELQGRLAQVKLNALTQEGVAFHIHQHLDLFVNGKHVSVPAGIGIYDNTFITEMHTHDADGVLHVESGKNRPYTLGQFFGEWSVRLNTHCLGRYCGNLHWWINGKPQSGNPADLVVRAHQEIAIAAGKPPTRIPTNYKFPAGE